MDTKQKAETVIELKFAYIDRLLKATQVKVGIAETVLNVKQTLKEAQKKLPKGATITVSR